MNLIYLQSLSGRNLVPLLICNLFQERNQLVIKIVTLLVTRPIYMHLRGNKSYLILSYYLKHLCTNSPQFQNSLILVRYRLYAFSTASCVSTFQNMLHSLTKKLTLVYTPHSFLILSHYIIIIISLVFYISN